MSNHYNCFSIYIWDSNYEKEYSMLLYDKQYTANDRRGSGTAATTHQNTIGEP